MGWMGLNRMVPRQGNGEAYRDIVWRCSIMPVTVICDMYC